MTFEIIIGILLAGILSNNYALLHFLGTGAVIENERSSRKSLIIGGCTTLVMVVAKRARQLTDIAKPIKEGDKTFTLELEHVKPVPTAVYELYEGKVEYSRNVAAV